jgi:DNA-binding response OmpR family regulator
MDAGIAAVGEVSLDPRDRTVRVGEEQTARLSPKTFELFHLLLTRYPAPVDKRELFKTLEGRDEIGVSRALDLLLNRLRKAVGPALADRIKSVKGYGYVYIAEPPRER